MTTHRRRLRREKGPRFREGPPGVLRASYARCGLCQLIELLPARGGHPRSSRARIPRGWTWSDHRGAVHERCAAYALRRDGGEPPGPGRASRRSSGPPEALELEPWTGPPVLVLDPPPARTGGPPPRPPELLAVLGVHPAHPRTVRVAPLERQRDALAPVPGGSRWAPLAVLRPPRKRRRP